MDVHHHDRQAPVRHRHQYVAKMTPVVRILLCILYGAASDQEESATYRWEATARPFTMGLQSPCSPDFYDGPLVGVPWNQEGIPDQYDLRDDALPVRDQGDCSLCWAFCSIALVEFALRRETGTGGSSHEGTGFRSHRQWIFPNRICCHATGRGTAVRRADGGHWTIWYHAPREQLNRVGSLFSSHF